jgi:hypothetical protein
MNVRQSSSTPSCYDDGSHFSRVISIRFDASASSAEYGGDISHLLFLGLPSFLLSLNHARFFVMTLLQILDD